MSSPIGLAATRQLVATALAVPSARAVVLRNFAGLPAHGSRFGLKLVRTYAAAAVATKRATAASGAKKTSATAKKPAAKKTTTAVKKTTTKAKVATKAKAKAKPKTKAKAKAKPKAAKAKKGRKVVKRKPSEEVLLKRRRQELKRAALFTEPKLLAETPWPLFIAEQTKGKETTLPNARSRLSSLSEMYRALPEAQLRRLKTTTEQNKASNAETYKKWVESHTPEQINSAISARKLLKAKFNFPKGSMKTIQDARIPKRPLTAYAQFTKSKWASGDIANTKSVVDSIRLLSQEWKNLSPEARQPYVELAKTDMDRYEKDVGSVLHREVFHSKTG